MRRIRVAATQMACGWDRAGNLDRAEQLVRAAAGQGAQVVLLQELFETPYFCADEKSSYFGLATTVEENAAVRRFRTVAKELGIVLPVSFFERGHNSYFNSLAMIDADGKLLSVYRKSHIPQAPGYQEKFYFTPGDSGIAAIDTAMGRIGAGICWDQWFPECARAMMLMGADILFYPTAIGSEPDNPGLDTKDLWQRAMIGHAVSNVVPVVAANRTGVEQNQTFYGSSFIASHRGDKVQEFGRTEEGVLQATFDIDEVRRNRAAFGFFRDRRPELYGILAKDQ